MKVINGFSNYTIDKDGTIRNIKTGRALKPSLNGRGYYFVNLYKDGKKKPIRIHRLIAENLIPNPENLPVVRHLDDDKTNNDIKNLAWGNQSENMKDMYRNGYKNHRRKLTEEQVKEIFYDSRLHREIAKQYGMHRQTVSQIKRKKIYKEITDVL